MSLPIVIEFKGRILNTNDLKLKKYILSDSIVIEIKTHRLLIHPPILYRLSDKNLEIGLAPFVAVDSSGNYTLYSIALENSTRELQDVTGNTYEFTILDSNSILVNEGTTGKILRILKVAVDSSTIEQLDLSDLGIYTRAIHPTLYNYALFLTDKKELYSITLSDTKPLLEFISRCTSYSLRKVGSSTSTLCVDDSNLHTIVSSKIYGFYVRLTDKNNKHDDNISQTYGYAINNVYFVKLGTKGYIVRLDTPDTEIHCNELNMLRPLAVSNNNMLIGLTLKKDAITLLDLEKNTMDTIAKVNLREILDIDIDVEQNNLVLTYSDYVYVFNILEKPKYIKLKSEDTLSATLAKDSLIVFRKNAIDVYKLDIASNRMYLEKIGSIPKYFVYCKTLTQDVLLCIDKLSRMIVLRLKNLLKSYHYVLLRSSLGTVMYVHGFLAPLVISSIHEDRGIRMNSSKLLLYVDNEEILRQLAIYENRARYKASDRVFIDIPENVDDIRILVLGDKPVLIDNKDNSYKYMSTYLTTIDGAKAIKIPLDTKWIEGVGNPGIFKGFTSIFLAKEQGSVEFGIAVDRARIKIIDYDDMLHYHDDHVCLSDYLSNILPSSSSIVFTALCSNTITKSLGKCVDLRSCEKLLKLILEVGDSTSISIPIQHLAVPRRAYVENIDRVDVAYVRGLQYLLLPKKCIDIAQALLRLDRFRIIIALSLVNRCKNVGAILSTKNYTLPIEPNSRKDVEIEIELDDMISDSGIHMLILEGTGNILQYSIKLDLRFFIAKAIGIALKIAKVVGVRASVAKNIDHIYKDYERYYRKNSF